jgi:hypothetical protein
MMKARVLVTSRRRSRRQAEQERLKIGIDMLKRIKNPTPEAQAALSKMEEQLKEVCE